MADAATLSVLLKTRGLDGTTRDLKNMRQELGGAGQSAQKSSLNFKAMALQITAVAATAAAIGLVSMKMINAASDAEEMRNKFEATFGQATPRARKALVEFGEEVGRGSLVLQTMAADVGAVLKSAGLMESQAADLSVELTKLATDVASFTNANDADVLQAFTRALTGEREALKTYGISILEAEVKAQGMAMGLELVAGQLSSTDKALATYQLLLNKTTDSQGDAAKTSESYANQAKNLQGQIGALSASLGTLLLPSATKIVTVLSNMTAGAVEAADAFAESLTPGLRSTREEMERILGLRSDTSQLRAQRDELERLKDQLEEVTFTTLPLWQRALASFSPQTFIDMQLDIEDSIKQVGSAIEETAAKIETEAGTALLALSEISVEAGSGLVALSAAEVKAAKEAEEMAAAIVRATDSNDAFAFSFLVIEENAKSLARQYEATTAVALASIEREEQARQRVSQSWDDLLFQVSDVGKGISEFGLNTEDILRSIAETSGESFDELVANFKKAGDIGPAEIQKIIESFEGGNEAVQALIASLKEALGVSGLINPDDTPEGQSEQAKNAQRTSIRNTQQHLDQQFNGLNGQWARETDPVRKAGLAAQIEQNRKDWQAATDRLQGLAKGGTIRTAGDVIVGERGPEILSLSPAQVTPLGAGGGGGGDIHYHQNAPIYGVPEAKRFITDTIVKAKKAGHPGLR